MYALFVIMEIVLYTNPPCLFIKKTQITIMPQTSRARYLDEAKGLGILCIVFLHYENGVIPWTVNTFIGSFMITIFYIIAGWIMAMKGKKFLLIIWPRNVCVH